MILSRLEVSNFRSFRGTHTLNLSPCDETNSKRPIVLFGGLNGTGKTTLFLAIKLALYGRAIGEGGYTTDRYTSFIRSSIHRYPSAIVKPNTASVELEFQYGKQGKLYTYIVQRTWEIEGSNLKETLKIWIDGEEQKSLDQTDVQGCINELVPQGVADLFLIDGEKIGFFATDSTGSMLRSAFERLYGLDLTERLRNDLQTYLRKNTTPFLNVAVDTDGIRKEYELVRKELVDIRSQLQCVEEKLFDAQTLKHKLETNLRSGSGEWEKEYSDLRLEANILSSLLQEKKHKLREEIAGIFPFSLAQETMQQLHDDVTDDLEMLMQRHANGTLQHFAESIRNELDQKGKESVDEVLANWLHKRSVKENVFDVTPKKLRRIEQVVYDDLNNSIHQSERLLEEIVSDSNELQTLEQKLSRSPDDEALKTEFDKFLRVCDRISELKSNIATLEFEVKTKLKQAIKLGTTLSERHRDTVEHVSRKESLEYAERIRYLLKEYRETSVLKRIGQLEEQFNSEFNLLSRKDRRHCQVKIDPKSFQVHFQCKNRGDFQTTQLSAGEKHIYAIAMLVALAKTSNRPLPLIIDSPLGRLDSDHNKKLVNNYFPFASHQVILFSTDEEIDTVSYEALSEKISRSYLINFDETEEESHIVNGYFSTEKLGEP